MIDHIMCSYVPYWLRDEDGNCAVYLITLIDRFMLSKENNVLLFHRH